MTQQPGHELTSSPNEVKIVTQLLWDFRTQESLTYYDGRLPSAADEPDLKKAAQPSSTPVRSVDTAEVRQQWQQAAETLPGFTERLNELGEAIITSYDWRLGMRREQPDLMKQLSEAVRYFGYVEGDLLMQVAIARLSDKNPSPVDVFHEVPKVAEALGFKDNDIDYSDLVHTLLHSDIPLMPSQPGEQTV